MAPVDPPDHGTLQVHPRDLGRVGHDVALLADRVEALAGQASAALASVPAAVPGSAVAGSCAELSTLWERVLRAEAGLLRELSAALLDAAAAYTDTDRSLAARAVRTTPDDVVVGP